jgi:hypothetical protein
VIQAGTLALDEAVATIKQKKLISRSTTMKRPKPKVDLCAEFFPMTAKGKAVEQNGSTAGLAKDPAAAGEQEQKLRQRDVIDEYGLCRVYPVTRNGKHTCVPTDTLTDRELLENEQNMRREGEGILGHADRLRAYFERRRGRN